MRCLKQVIVVRKDLMLTQGKLGPMVAHAAMTFLVKKLRITDVTALACKVDPEQALPNTHYAAVMLTPEQAQWLIELDPGLEEHGQVSFAKILCQVADEPELLAVEAAAKAAGLTCHRVVDSGHTHCAPGTLVCIAIGPDWPERLDPVTGRLKVYR